MRLKADLLLDQEEVGFVGLHREAARGRALPKIIGIASILWLLVGCSAPAIAPTPVPPTVSATLSSIPPIATSTPPPTSTPTTAPIDKNREDGLSGEEIATLSSLEQVDGYPLYTMHYYGAYNQRVSSARGVKWLASANRPNSNLTALPSAWACALFAALGDADNMFYGRNFDWQYSPAVLLFTDPPDGYASVSMVDIAYLGFGGTRVGTLTDLPLIERRALLDTPIMPFDGMNEHGLVVGMAAVPGSEMPYDRDKETIDSLMVIRKMLDHARDVDEALAILQSYNIRWGGGPPLHYLIADSPGHTVLVEFYEGEMVMIPNETSWHLATNHLRAIANETGPSGCWRYDKLYQRLTEAEGQLTTQDAIDLLAEVSQEGTQWSVAYGMSTGDVNVTMGRQYDNLHTFHLSLAGE
jgi:hypothetical protein